MLLSRIKVRLVPIIVRMLIERNHRSARWWPFDAALGKEWRLNDGFQSNGRSSPSRQLKKKLGTHDYSGQPYAKIARQCDGASGAKKLNRHFPSGNACAPEL
jgi:hypothetical protein